MEVANDLIISEVIIRLIPVLAILLIAQIVLIVFALNDLLPRRPENIRGNKLVWTLVIIFVTGGIGAILYFIIGRKD